MGDYPETPETYKQWIEESRERFGDPPRQFTQELWHHWQVRMPPGFDDPRALPLQQLYYDREQLFHEGMVVWGSVLAANPILYQPGFAVAPGYVFFSLHVHYDSHPTDLLELATGCFEARDHGGDPELKRIMAIADRRFDFRMCEPVHPDATGGRQVYFSSIEFHRKYLPKNLILDHLMPLIVDPARTGAVWILPAECWADGQVEWWDQLATEKQNEAPQPPKPIPPRPRGGRRRKRF